MKIFNSRYQTLWLVIASFMFNTYWSSDLAYSQIECGTTVTAGITKQVAAPYGDPSQLSAFMPTAIRHVNIAIHIVRHTNQSGGIASTDGLERKKADNSVP